MPVVNNDGSLYGIVCADDLFDAFSEEIYNLSKVTNVQINKERSDAMPGILKDLAIKAQKQTQPLRPQKESVNSYSV